MNACVSAASQDAALAFLWRAYYTKEVELIAIRCGERPRSHKALILEHATLTTTVCEATKKGRRQTSFFVAVLTVFNRPGSVRCELYFWLGVSCHM